MQDRTITKKTSGVRTLIWARLSWKTVLWARRPQVRRILLSNLNCSLRRANWFKCQGCQKPLKNSSGGSYLGAEGSRCSSQYWRCQGRKEGKAESKKANPLTKSLKKVEMSSAKKPAATPSPSLENDKDPWSFGGSECLEPRDSDIQSRARQMTTTMILQLSVERWSKWYPAKYCQWLWAR